MRLSSVLPRLSLSFATGARGLKRNISSTIFRSKPTLKNSFEVVSDGNLLTDPVPAQYRFALMRHIDPTLAVEGLRSNPDSGAVDISAARYHHDFLAECLATKCGLKLFHLDSDGFPDSVFIEDTAVALNGTILITRPGDHSRQGETEAVRNFFKTHEWNDLSVVDLEKGTLDGGDVLFTGKEFFVGLSNRTNMEGILSLAKVYSDYRVTAVDINHSDFDAPLTDTVIYPPLHLKSICSRAGDTTLLVGGFAGKVISRIINITSPGAYDIVALPDMTAANCVWANDVLITPLESEMTATSMRLLRNLKGSHVSVATNELAKLDGAITCCSILLQ